jgi:DNA-binding GntR family transcriptional regulator
VLREHEELLEAIAGGDGDRARETAERHMAGARRVRLRMYAEGQPTPGGDGGQA